MEHNERRRTTTARGSELEHLDGVPWWEAAPPPRDHTCEAQTAGWSGLTRIERCACGGVNLDAHHPTSRWWDRNARAPQVVEAGALMRGQVRRWLAGSGIDFTETKSLTASTFVLHCPRSQYLDVCQAVAEWRKAAGR